MTKPPNEGDEYIVGGNRPEPKSWDDLMRLAKQAGPFEPQPHYCPASDSIVVYFSNEGSYGDPSQKGMTIYRSLDDERPVGVRIWGASKLLAE